MSACFNNRISKALQGFLFRYVTDKPIARLFINDMDNRPFPGKGVGNRLADPLRASGDDRDFLIKGFHLVPGSLP